MLNRIYKVKKILLTTVLINGLLTACSSGEKFVNTPMTETDLMAPKNSNEVHTNFLQVSNDDFDLATPNFYYSSDNEAFWSIQTNIAEDLYDHEALCVVRIDIPKENGLMPTGLAQFFSIGVSFEFEEFLGEILIFNGKEATYNRVEAGVISFSESEGDAGYVGGFFQVILYDYDADVYPVPEYFVTGLFGFEIGTNDSVISTQTDNPESSEETGYIFESGDDELPGGELILSI